MAETLIPVPGVRGAAPTLPDFFRWRVGASIGVTLLGLGLLAYTSEHPVILHRWSVTYFIFVLVVSFLAARLWSRSWRLAHGYAPEPSTAGKCLDVAILSWGVASLIASLENPARASDILGGNLLGFEAPAATLLGWLPLGLLAAAVLSRRLVREEIARRPWLLSVVAVILVALMGEGATRFWAVVHPEVQAFPTHRTSMWLHRYAPVNDSGFRKADNGVLAGVGARRLLVIGNSYAFGWGIQRSRDRISNLLVAALDTATGTRWDLYDASRPDLDTRQEIDLATSLPRVHPDVAVILYVFNDIEYLAPTTERLVITEAPRGLLDRVNPARLLFLNSFLAQEAYVQVRHVRTQSKAPDLTHDRYADQNLVERHLQDLCRLVKVASDAQAVVGVVPLDIATTQTPAARERMDRFTSQAVAAGIPIWRVDSAFVGHKFTELRVNPLDAHPNELTHRLAGAALAQQVVPILWGAKPRPKVSCEPGLGTT